MGKSTLIESFLIVGETKLCCVYICNDGSAVVVSDGASLHTAASRIRMRMSRVRGASSLAQGNMLPPCVSPGSARAPGVRWRARGAGELRGARPSRTPDTPRGEHTHHQALLHVVPLVDLNLTSGLRQVHRDLSSSI